MVIRVNWNSSSNPIAYVGGNYNSNANFGFFYLSVYYTASETNANVGSRHLVYCIIAQINPYRLVKILPIRTGPSRTLSNRLEANKE